MYTKSEQLLSRRDLLKLSGQISISGISCLVAGGCENNDSVICSDPSSLSDSELSLRESLQYTKLSTNNEEVCALCAFFTASAQFPCGTCRILNGTVNADGHCDSWSPISGPTP